MEYGPLQGQIKVLLNIVNHPILQACTCAERREVNKALTGENSVFTRRGRNSERGTGFGHNESRSRIQPMSGNVARSPVAPETIEIQAGNVTNRHESGAGEPSPVSRSDDEGNSNGTQQAAVNGFTNKIDDPLTRSQNSNPTKEGNHTTAGQRYSR